MSRIAPPAGYSSWNTYMNAQADASPNQSRAARAKIKRDIKLSKIAQVERQAGGNVDSASYRTLNKYNAPGTAAPIIGHPWQK
jgi:hypothetical protein